MNVRNIHNIAVAVYSLFILYVNNFIPDNGQEISSIITSFLGITLVIGNLYYLFIDRGHNKIKTIDSLTSKNNFGNYLQALLLLYITRLDNFHPYGTFFYLTVTLSLVLFCIWIIIKEAVKNRTLKTAIIIGHTLFCYFMVLWSKNTFTRHYGNEIIGSFWEKSNYKTKYLVKLYIGESEEYYTLPAQLHVYSDFFIEDYDDNYQTYSEKFIMVETVYLNNGDSLTFEDCNLNEGGKVYCIDDYGKTWYIELILERFD